MKVPEMIGLAKEILDPANEDAVAYICFIVGTICYGTTFYIKVLKRNKEEE